MATVHPSRLGLVPVDPIRDDRSRRPDDASGYAHERGSARRHDDDDRGRRSRRERSRSRSRTPQRHDRERDRQVRKEQDRSRSYERHGRGGGNERRRSPEYGEYKNRSPQRDAPAAPWRVQENMYPPRGGRGRNDQGVNGGYGGSGSDYFESRRKQRENNTFSIWPPSPKERPRELSPTRESKSKSKKRSKRRRSESPSSVSSPSEVEDRREKREKKRTRRDREREERREKRRHRAKSTRSEDDSDDGYRDRDRRRHRSRRSEENSGDDRSRDRRDRSGTQDKSRKGSMARSPTRSEEEDQWVEKQSESRPHAVEPAGTIITGRNEVILKKAMDSTRNADDSDEEVGPQPLQKITTSTKKIDERDYGGALLRGEGSAMAAFLQEGGTDARIPRRGEIGLQSEEIAAFEQVGYVMSGSRHRRMNAVRMRKENQVISAEEKRGILKLQREERERREAILRDEFKELVHENLKADVAQKKT